MRSRPRYWTKKAKLSISKTVFVPIPTYGHESWAMTKRVQSQAVADLGGMHPPHQPKHNVHMHNIKHLKKSSH